MRRLYSSFQPDSYDISIVLDRDKRTFSGEVIIVGNANAGAGELRLHAKDLTIHSAEINDAAVAAELNEDDELVLTAKDAVTAGENKIRVAFEGVITDSMHGIYPCYFEHDGVKKELLATQFESHHAREVFPCIDEPEAKAAFSLTLGTEKNITVLGNMPVKEQKQENETQITTFEMTPKMSTYLLAFVVGELKSAETTTKSGVLVRSWATTAQPAGSLAFSLQHAADTLDFFDDYFGVAFPLPKCDHVALPDFSAGAMENWGLITYRETTLLVDPKNTSTASKQYVASVVTHELSHQWFGNLVTMKWWDDLWLNESFASLMEYVGVHGLHPEWDVWLDFGPNDRAPALHRDMLPGVQAVRTDVSHPDEISTLFDPSIVYAKGATLMNMVRAYIGDDAFRDGLRRYFKAHQYANTRGSDLWAAFAEASGKDINGFMNAWLEKPGYPVVRIDQRGTEVRLSQKRLLSMREDTASLWPVPLFSKPEMKQEVLESQEETLTLPDDTFRLLNADSKGLFVSHYQNEEHRAFLAGRLAKGTLDPADRLRLLHDSLLLARAGEQSLSDSLELALLSDKEDRDAVWDIINLIIADTRRFIDHDEKLVSELKRRVRALVALQLETLGFSAKTDDSLDSKKRRATVFALAVWAEHEEALAYALSQFDSFARPDELDSDSKGVIYAAGARHKNLKAYEKLFGLYKSTTSAEEKHILAAGMTASDDAQVIDELLSHIKDPALVRPQDVGFWFAYLIRKRSSREKTWQWMVGEWSWIEQKFGSDKSYDNFPRYASGALFGKKWLKSYRDFFEPKMQQPSLKRVVSVGLEEVASRTGWFERDEPRLRSFLS